MKVNLMRGKELVQCVEINEVAYNDARLIADLCGHWLQPVPMNDMLIRQMIGRGVRTQPAQPTGQPVGRMVNPLRVMPLNDPTGNRLGRCVHDIPLTDHCGQCAQLPNPS